MIVIILKKIFRDNFVLKMADFKIGTIKITNHLVFIINIVVFIYIIVNYR